MARVPLLVLASSRRGGGRCVAGWRLDGEGGWVRPITRGDAALQQRHCEVEGRWPRTFDVVRIELVEPEPKPWHPEDSTIGDEPWEYVETAVPQEVEDVLDSIVDHDARIIVDHRRTVPAEEYRSNPLEHSLVLVEPEDLSWRIEEAPWGGIQRKANFSLPGRGSYEFMVTDREIEDRLWELPVGSHDRSAVGLDDGERVFLTVSVAEPFEQSDTCSKLVAGVVRVPAAEAGASALQT